MAEQKVVAVVTFHVTAATFDEVRERVTETLQRGVSKIPGLIEASVLTNEQTTRVVVVSTWESREDWAEAQWDGTVERTVADAFRDTASYDLDFYSLLARVEPKREPI